MTHARTGDGAHLAHQAFAHPTRNVAALGIQPGMRVADFGAGSGAYVLAIAESLSDTGAVYAIDVQKDLLRRIANEATRHNFHNVEIVWADLEKREASKLKEHTLDLVLISNLLFQLHDRKEVFREARRILKKNGRLAVIDWGDASKGIGPAKAYLVGKDEAIALAREVGFELAREFSAGAHHYGLIFRAGVVS